RDLKAASRIAKKHSSFMKGRTYLKAHGEHPLRHAFEFRHPSFMKPEFIELMRKHGVALVFAHSGLKSPYAEDLTADFVYARMHGQEKKFKKGYPNSVLDWWAERALCWSTGNQPDDAQCVSPQEPVSVARDLYIYFDTEAKKYAPLDALNLSRRLLPNPAGRKKSTARQAG
ncbi:MAG: DUF72 domain-containing protein, partial [Bdellovibrionales bacterium]